MPEHRLPKIYLLALIRLATSPLNTTNCNWVQLLSNHVALINKENLLNNLTAGFWKAKRNLVIIKYKEYKREVYLARYLASTAF